MSSNIVFWLVAVALLVATIAAVTWPLLRERREPSGPGADPEIDSTRHELAQLEARRASGEISQDEYAQLKQALAVRLLEQIAVPGAGTSSVAATSDKPAIGSKDPVPPGSIPPAARRSRWIAPAAAAFVIVLAAVFYAFLGLPGMARHPTVAAGDEAQGAGDVEGKAGALTQQQLQRMVDEMNEKVKADPKDAAAWSMLAHSYDMMRKFDESTKAYAKATQLVDNNAQLWADYADSLAMAQGRTLEGEPMTLIKKALALDGNNTKALALAGSHAFEQKDFAGAVSYWEKAAKFSNDAEFTRQLQSGVTEAKALQQGMSPEAAARATAAAEKNAPDAKSPDAKSPAAASSSAKSSAGSATAGSAGSATAGSSSAKSSSAAAGKSTVSGRVSLAPALKDKASPDDTVFIFARATSGPRMPLAMMRRQVRDLPIDFTLDDSQSMMEGLTLSQHKTVIIGARISKRGDAMAQAGDLQGLTPAIDVGSSDIKLEISEVVK